MTEFLKDVSTEVLPFLERPEGDGYASEDVLAPLVVAGVHMQVRLIIDRHQSV